jgi:F-type H+-transporting ATPase subunit alpha
VREVLKQKQSRPLSATEQIAILYAVTNGLLDTVPLDQLDAAEQRICQAVTRQLPELCERIQKGKPLTESEGELLLHTIQTALTEGAPLAIA